MASRKKIRMIYMGVAIFDPKKVLPARALEAGEVVTKI